MKDKHINIDNNKEVLMSNMNLLKLIALILVVVGHSTGPYGNGWTYNSEVPSNLYKFILSYVGSFHLVIFVYVSGLTYAYGRIKRKSYKTYWQLIKKKFNRLILPYLLVGSLYVIPIAMILNLDGDNNYYMNLKNFILGYDNGHLWYLLMLFVVFLIYYFIEKKMTTTKNITLVTIIFLGIYLISLKGPQLFEINTAMNYLLFFHLGYCSYLYKDRIFLIVNNILERYKGLIIVSSIFLIVIMMLIKSKLPYIKAITWGIYKIIDIVIAILGVVQAYTLVLIINKTKFVDKLNKFNKYNFSIYLLHEPLIYIILSHLLPLNAKPTIVVLLCFSLSITTSILISKIYYYFIKYLNKIFRCKFKIREFKKFINN